VRPAAPALLLLALATACSRVVRPVATPVPAAAPADVESTLFLIGDAGAPAEDEPVLAALEQMVRATPEPKHLVYLGDNIYPRGLPDSGAIGRDEAERRIDAQIAVGVRTETATWFIPGNHDWAYMGPEGWDAVVRQGKYIDEHGRPWVRQIPAGGCPGPVSVDIGRSARMIALDTQWWLHDFDKPRDSTSACRYYDAREVALALDRAIAGAAPRHAIVVGHHPLISGSEHGGHLGLMTHLFPLRTLFDWAWIPLPILGSSYAFSRAQGASNQDVRGPENVRMRRIFNWVFTRRKPLVYAAGHEHTLQVFEGYTARNLLVNGTGIAGHVSPVHWLENTLYAAAVGGFMRIDFLRDGRARLGVFTVDADRVTTESYSSYLRQEQ
jgi:hypothetical protein